MNTFGWFETLFNWLHLVAATVWIGGLVFSLVTLRGDNPEQLNRLTESALRFRPLQWLAMAALVLTGVYRIVMVGGMKALPVVLHIKITLGLLMVLAGLVTTLGLLPRLAANPEPGLARAYRGINALIVLLGLVVFWILEANGLV